MRRGAAMLCNGPTSPIANRYSSVSDVNIANCVGNVPLKCVLLDKSNCANAVNSPICDGMVDVRLLPRNLKKVKYDNNPVTGLP
jgi:hypothetical protein